MLYVIGGRAPRGVLGKPCNVREMPIAEALEAIDIEPQGGRRGDWCACDFFGPFFLHKKKGH